MRSSALCLTPFLCPMLLCPCAGICDGMTYEGIADKYPDEAAARKRDKLRYRYPAGESYMDVIQRVEPVIIELERERETVVVVAHQAVLR